MKTIMQRRGDSLVPDNPVAMESLHKVPDNTYVTVEFKRARNPLHHRKLFALLQTVLENQTVYRTVDELLTAFKFAVGHTDTVMVGNVEHTYPKSISYANMGQDEFEVFYRQMIVFMCQYVIPGMDDRELEDTVMEMVI